MNSSDLALIAFETYAEVVCDEDSEWAALSSQEKRAWRAVANRLLDEVQQGEREPGSLFGGGDDE